MHSLMESFEIVGNITPNTRAQRKSGANQNARPSSSGLPNWICDQQGPMQTGPCTCMYTVPCTVSVCSMYVFQVHGTDEHGPYYRFPVRMQLFRCCHA